MDERKKHVIRKGIKSIHASLKYLKLKIEDPLMVRFNISSIEHTAKEMNRLIREIQPGEKR